MNPYFNDFKKQITSPVKYRLFLLSKLPAAFFAGLSVEYFDSERSVITVKQKWFNKNPFGSIYFAVLTMAAEMSTGILCMANIYKRKPAVSMLVTKNEAFFSKKALGKISFTCTDGAAIQAITEEAIASGESKSITCYAVGKNEQDEIVAELFCTWSFKARSSK